jgi:hypothetical protein
LGFIDPDAFHSGVDVVGRADDAFAASASGRNLPLGLSLLALLAVAGWLVWLAVQPPLFVELPVVAAPPAAETAVSPAEVEATHETLSTSGAEQGDHNFDTLLAR